MDATDSPAVHVVGIDHVVLNVADTERSLAFYLGDLGLAPVRVDEWRRGEVFFASVRVDPTTIIDLLEVAPDGRNVDHVCLVVEQVDLQALADSGRFEVVDGPDQRYGAQGDGTSLYVKDPDGHVVELRHYGPARGVASSNPETSQQIDPHGVREP
jgi:catechol 2,3-dioxygenase-like lactoylglutathione lyase family enzyme